MQEAIQQAAGMAPTTAAIIAIVGGALSAGGVVVRIVDWLRARHEAQAKIEEKRVEVGAVVEGKALDADLTINDRLLRRIETLEARMDAERKEHAEAVAKLDARNDECERRYDALALKSDANEREIEERKRREKELSDANRLIQYSYENLRADITSLRKHVDRLESENRRLRERVENEARGGR